MRPWAYFQAAVYIADRGQPPALLFMFPTEKKDDRRSVLLRAAFDGVPRASVLTSNAPLLRELGGRGRVWRAPDGEWRRPWRRS